jgi:hypothetical protein
MGIQLATCPRCGKSPLGHHRARPLTALGQVTPRGQPWVGRPGKFSPAKGPPYPLTASKAPYCEAMAFTRTGSVTASTRTAIGGNANNESDQPQYGNADPHRGRRFSNRSSAVDVHAEKADEAAPFQVWPRMRQSHRRTSRSRARVVSAPETSDAGLSKSQDRWRYTEELRREQSPFCKTILGWP